MKSFLSYILIILGAILASFSVACILLPNDAIDYGTAGIGILISMVTGLNLSLCVLIVFLPFLIAGAIFLGANFLLKASVGAAVYMLGLEFFEKIDFTLNTEHFIAVAFGGAILGVGLSLILRLGSCIDGSEILANIIIQKLYEKTGKNYSMTTILVIFNAFVYVAAFFVISQNGALLSLLVYIVATTVIDHFTDRFESIKKVTIITKDPDTIIADIKATLNKTCTATDSRGAIAGDNTTLVCYISYFEMGRMKQILSRNKGTYSTVSTIDEIIKDD